MYPSERRFPSADPLAQQSKAKNTLLFLLPGTMRQEPSTRSGEGQRTLALCHATLHLRETQIKVSSV